MKATTYGMVEAEQRHQSPAQAPTVDTTVTEAEVDDRGGFGLRLGCIEVQRADGKAARFWVTLYRTNQGRIQAEIRANHASHETEKRVTGSWLDYAARAGGEDSENIGESLVIVVRRTEAGTYEVPGAAEVQDTVAALADLEPSMVEDYGPLEGWEDWSRVYCVEDRDGLERWFFAR